MEARFSGRGEKMILAGQIITSLLLAIAAIGVGGVLLGGLAIILNFMSKRDVAWLIAGTIFVIYIASVVYDVVFT